jgi:putative RNA methylase family UPF0020
VRRRGLKEERSPRADGDTSPLLEELMATYSKRGKGIEVDFRKLVDWVRAGDQFTHQIHPYPAKLLPHIASFFSGARCLTGKGQSILDPFCGSGTVALESSLAGRQPLIADANPLALMLAQVKTTSYDVSTLEEVGRQISVAAARFRTAPIVPIVNALTWYLPRTKAKLERLLRAICEANCSESVRNFFKVSFSSTARRLSLADPAISVPVRLRVKESFTVHRADAVRTRLEWLSLVDPFEEFQKVVAANIVRVMQANKFAPDRLTALVVGEDVRRLGRIGTRSAGGQYPRVPLVLTSPPYGSAQKYVRASSLGLNWLSLASPSELASLERASIGREHAPGYKLRALEYGDYLPRSYVTLISKIAKSNPLRAHLTATYLMEMRAAVDEICRVLSPNGHAVLVVGNNVVAGHTLRNDAFLTHCFTQAGCSLELSLLDDIHSRGLMTKRNRTASVISREIVLVFRKPKK